MKQQILLVLFFLPLFLKAQTYTIPGATEQPAWVFPLWFEDALGNKDTLYFGYDPEAVDYGIPSSDTVFGEKFQLVDSSNFLTVWGGGGSYTDSGFYGRNVTITTLEYLMGAGIGFYSTWYPPLILRWDKNLFYSDVLPFPDNGDAPKALGQMSTSADMVPEGECSFQYPYYMTDTVAFEGGCVHADSMVFLYGSLAVLNFSIRPWLPYWDEIISTTDYSQQISIYPNPAQTAITFLASEIIFCNYTILSMNGNEIENGTIQSSKTIDVSEYKKGMYFVLFFDAEKNVLQSEKFVVQ